MMLIVIIHQDEAVMTGDIIFMTLSIIIRLQVDVMAGEDVLILNVVIHTIMKRCLEYKFKCKSS
eukprot:5171022-Ditylum_brightwellii.AAC.1